MHSNVAVGSVAEHDGVIVVHVAAEADRARGVVHAVEQQTRALRLRLRHITVIVVTVLRELVLIDDENTVRVA